MAPTVSRPTTQSKISDSFRATAKATKPLKQTKPAVKPIPKAPVDSVKSEEKDPINLNPNDPKLVSAARAIQKDRQAPFGIFPRLQADKSASRRTEHDSYHSTEL